MTRIGLMTLLLAAALGLGFTDCYKPVTNSGLPSHIKTVAVPAFQFEARGCATRSSRVLPDAVTREIIRRGNGLKVQGSLDGADAVLEGTIRDFNFTGVLLDKDGRARIYEVTSSPPSPFAILRKTRSSTTIRISSFATRSNFRPIRDRSLTKKTRPSNAWPAHLPSPPSRLLSTASASQKKSIRCLWSTKTKLREELKRGELRPAYLLYGAETFLRDGAARYILEQAFGEGDFRDLN